MNGFSWDFFRYFSYSESCDLCTCNGNRTIAMICSTVFPMIESSLTSLNPITSVLPCPFPFGSPSSPKASITCNYMTTEEVKEFMLNEQKV